MAKGSPSARKLLGRVSGSRLCFGDPIRSGTRTIVPVTRVRVAGGFGGELGADGGGGGALRADPIGFVDVSEDRARFRPIVDPFRVARGVTSMGLVGGLVALGLRGDIQLPRRRKRFRR